MIVDSSAIVAVLRGEKGAKRLLRAMVQAQAVRMSAATYVELSLIHISEPTRRS